MKISEVTEEDAAKFCKIDGFEENDLLPYMIASKQFVLSYTGIKAENLDNYEDITIAYLVLIQDMHDNRTMYIDKTNVNKVVDCILGLHNHNLIA